MVIFVALRVEFNPADAKVAEDKIQDLVENNLCDSLKYVEGTVKVDVTDYIETHHDNQDSN